MELLLWLWFYDNRWFFNININLFYYKTIWLIPVFLHVSLMTICTYFLLISETFYCDKSLSLWLYSRIFFSFLISTTIICFMMQITNYYLKEQHYLDHSKLIYPKMKKNIKSYDFFIRRRSLMCFTGVLLLFLGVISLFWSYMIISFYHFQNYYQNCDIKIQKFLNFHSIAILIGNVPLFIICLLLVFMKVSSYVSAYICPDTLIGLSVFFSPKNPVNSE